jgi:hypothetical protein
MGYRRVAFWILVWKHGETRPLEKPRSRIDDNTKIYLQKVKCAAWNGSSWRRIRTGGGYF